jgi:hypothetical protein
MHDTHEEPTAQLHEESTRCEPSVAFLSDESFSVTPREQSLIAGEAQPIGVHSISWNVFLSNDDVLGMSKTDRKI